MSSAYVHEAKNTAEYIYIFYYAYMYFDNKL